MLRLRLSRGLDLKEFIYEFPDDITENKINRILKKAELFKKGGFVTINNNVIALTDEGALVSNSIIAELAELL